MDGCTERRDVTRILLKTVLNTIQSTPSETSISIPTTGVQIPGGLWVYDKKCRCTCVPSLSHQLTNGTASY